jgi:hypothetical protein
MIRKFCVMSAGVAALTLPVGSQAFNFSNDEGTVKGSLVSTVGVGFGYRVAPQSCSSIGDPGLCGGGSNVAQYSNGDYGDLNYGQHQLFSAQLKGTHELLTEFGDGYKAMARGTWVYDPAALATNYMQMSKEGENQVAKDVRILDLWLSKDFALDGNKARWRLGNQVQNWGESLYSAGGVNVTNALDVQKLLVPGTLLKEAVIPAPMLSFGATFGNGFTLDSYYQFWWNRSRQPPVGSYWSASNLYDKGRDPFNVGNYAPLSGLNANFGSWNAGAIAASQNGGGRASRAQIDAINAQLLAYDPTGLYGNTFVLNNLPDQVARSQGQYGIALHYRPEGKSLDLGAYVLNYHDKSPVLTYPNSSYSYQWNFLEDRKMYGVSANFPVGPVAVGWELSYRPKDALLLGACFRADGTGTSPGNPPDGNTNASLVATCPGYIDKERWQTHLTQQIYIEPGLGGRLLDLLGGATSAVFTAEEVGIYMPGVSPTTTYTRTIGGNTFYQYADAGYILWKQDGAKYGLPYAVAGGGGTAFSWGFTADFNFTYDGSVIPGWQLTPGLTFYDSVKGDTPDLNINFLHGVKSTNLYLLFTQSPGPGGRNWAAGLNYTNFFGGDAQRNFYADRDFVGGFVQYNF